MGPPKFIVHALRESGFRELADGAWKRGAQRWWVSCVEAPQSWERMLSPLLSQAILESMTGAASSGALPLAVLVAPRLSASMLARLEAFAGRVAPKQAWIAGDGRGAVSFHFPGEPGLKPRRSPGPLPQSPRPRRQVNLFSDLHQWMLKVLLAPRFERRLLSAPREPSIRNARVLAEVADVSVPAAARFVHALDKAGHLDRAFGDLRLAEPARLLEAWRAAASSSYREEVEAQFVRGPLDEQAFSLLMGFGGLSASSHSWKMAVGLFGACGALKLGHVSGGPRHLYVSSLDSRELEGLGLVVGGGGGRVDVVLRVPRFPESVFRGAVDASGMRVTDVLQCWLDVSHHRARGPEQADFLWRRAIAPALEEE
jgi:hypothetical protein